MKCEKCGNEIDENSKFCSNCGEEIKNDKQEEVIIEAEKVNNEEKKEEPIQSTEIIETETPINQSDVKQAEVVKEEKQGLSVASLILGIIAILCLFEHGVLNIACAILAIVFGVKGRKQGAKGLGTTGMVLGIVSLVLCAIVLIFLMIFASALLFGIAVS